MSAWQLGYCLHHKPFKEQQHFVYLWCAQRGRVDGIYRVSRRRPMPQPFTLYRWQLQGEGSLCQIRQCEVEQLSPPLQQQALFCGLYVNELLYRLWPVGQDDEQLFRQYRDCLMALSDSDNPALYLRQWEAQLLQALGEMPDWSVDDNQLPLSETAFYRFEPQVGLVLCDPRVGVSGQLWLLLAQQNYQHSAVQLLAKNTFRRMLSTLLGERPLHSRQLFQQYISRKAQ